MKFFPFFLVITILFFGCKSSVYDCDNLQIQTIFIGYSKPDIDTFIIRRYKAIDSFRTLIDTLMIKEGSGTYYKFMHDTASVDFYNFTTGGIHGIQAGYDWELFIPANNKTFRISEIVDEKRKGKCRNGIFSMDKFNCYCFNEIYSLKLNGQIKNFSNVTATETCKIYLRN